MLKIKLGVLVGAAESDSLSRFANTSLPFKTAKSLKAMLAQMQDVLQTYDKDKTNLLGEFCAKDEKGDFILNAQGGATFELGRLDLFNAEMGKVLHEEVEIIGDKLKPSQMLSSTVISANDLMLLEWLIESEDAKVMEAGGVQ